MFFLICSAYPINIRWIFIEGVDKLSGSVKAKGGARVQMGVKLAGSQEVGAEGQGCERWRLRGWSWVWVKRQVEGQGMEIESMGGG